jgi:telomerase reverse transcriptase
VAYARSMSMALKQTIFIDQVTLTIYNLYQYSIVVKVVYDFQSRTATLKLLEEHIRENIVKVRLFSRIYLALFAMRFVQIGRKYFQQIVGIPQGSALSTILCSFFFGDLERTHLNILDDPQSVCLLLLLCMRARCLMNT